MQYFMVLCAVVFSEETIKNEKKQKQYLSVLEELKAFSFSRTLFRTIMQDLWAKQTN